MGRLIACLWLGLAGIVVGGTSWRELAEMPEGSGRGGAFGGVVGGALVVAGGAHFPDGMPWEGGVKVWSDEIFVLDVAGGDWRSGGRLPGARGYGVSVSVGEGLLLIGGSDEREHHASCWILVAGERGELEVEEFPALPVALADMAGARVGDVIYVAGGTRAPGVTEAERGFYAIDLGRVGEGWRALEPLPGEGRLLPVAGARDGAFYLFSGAALGEGGDEGGAHLFGLQVSRWADKPRVAGGGCGGRRILTKS
jgi:N-acetylneuraminic acid mutarotase